MDDLAVCFGNFDRYVGRHIDGFHGVNGRNCVVV